MKIINKIQISESSEEYLTTEYKNMQMKYPKFHKMDVLCKLGIIATEKLLENQLFQHEYTGLLLSSNQGCIQTDLDFYKTIVPDSFFPSPTLFVYTLPNIVLGEICIKHKITGEHLFFMQENYNENQMNQLSEFYFKTTEMKYLIYGHLNATENTCETQMFLIEK